jgi:6-phosphogluconolactonase
MSHYELLWFESPHALGSGAARYWLDAARSHNGAMGVALSGGRVAKDFFKAVTRISREQGHSLNHMHFFWADERCVPPGDDDSNFKLAREYLLDPLRIESSHIHRIEGEMDPDRAAARAGKELREWAGKSADGRGKDGVALDFIFLGMGEDGHVASLFPHGPTPEEMTDDFIPVTAAKPPPRRISMNYHVIRSAREVLVLASGEGKETALRHSLASNGETPLARVLRMRRMTWIYTDVAL